MKRAAVLGLCFLSTSLFAAEPFAPSPLLGLVATGYFFPSAANTQGRFGAYFKTRMVLTNPTPYTMNITAGLSTETGSGGTQTITLGPSETRIYENFLLDVFGFVGGGGISLMETTPSRPFYAVGEVYTENANGRVGTALVGMSADDRVLNVPMRETGYSMSTGLFVDGSNRANLGCSNMDATAVVIRADIYNETSTGIGNPTAQVTLNLPANGWVQRSVPISGASIRILFSQLTAGGLYGSYCYGVNVNNQSGDGTLSPALYAPMVN